MRLRSLAAVSAVLAFTLAAKADSYTTFNANGVFASGSILSGTLTLDSTTGVFSAGNLTVTSPDNLTFNAVTQAANYPVSGVFTVQLGNGSPFQLPVLVFDIAADSLIGYQGGSFGSQTLPAKGYVSNIYSGPQQDDPLQSGALTIAATPEPSSLALLGTGLLGVAGAARRRLA